jgi:hypothetical protein
MAMYVFALSVIAIQGVTGFETKLLGNSDFAHFIF